MDEVVKVELERIKDEDERQNHRLKDFYKRIHE